MQLFQDRFVFGEATSSRFFSSRVITLRQQLLSQSSYFFRTAAFLRNSFFQKQSLFGCHYCRIASSFSCCHSLSLIVCHLLSLTVICCHSLSLAVICCNTHCQFCHSLSLAVTSLSFCKRSIHSIKFGRTYFLKIVIHKFRK